MSRLKFFIPSGLINRRRSTDDDNEEEEEKRTNRSPKPGPHITQIDIKPPADEKPPRPPTNYPMINRLVSTIDESLVNFNSITDEINHERERTLDELQKVFLQFRHYLDRRYHQYEFDIKSSYAQYDQHLRQLKIRFEQIRDDLILHFPSKNADDNDSFDFDHYRLLEKQINETLEEQRSIPRFRVELNQIERIDECFRIHCKENDRNNSIPMQRSFSVETSTSTNLTDEYDNVPSENSGRYRVAYHQALKTPFQTIERWTSPLESGNYFVPLLTPFRQNSLLIYCLDRQAFLSYHCQRSKTSIATIKWLGTRPSAVYWFDEMNMLFIACCTHIYGCYLEEDIEEYQRIPIRIPIEQTSTWSDTQGQVCWPKFLTCAGGIDRLLYAFWKDTDQSSSTITSLIDYQLDRTNFSIKFRHTLDGRLRALHSSLSTYRLALLIEHPLTDGCHFEVRGLRDFSLLAKFELRTVFEQFRYGCCLTNVFFNSSSYLLCDHKQQQLWHVNGETGDIKVKEMKEEIYSVTSLLDGTLALLVGSPMRFDFLYDPNDTGFLLRDLFREEQETFEV